MLLLLCLSSVSAVSQLERVLSSEQRRSDFMPRDDSLSFDRPTSACLLGTALLSALGAAAKDTLEGNNLRAFLAEVRGRRGASIWGRVGFWGGRGVECGPWSLLAEWLAARAPCVIPGNGVHAPWQQRAAFSSSVGLARGCMAEAMQLFAC